MENHKDSVASDAAFTVALLATAVAFGAALAHALELPNKIGMTRDHYFVVQRVYDGWNQLAYVLAVELLGILSVLALYRSRSAVFKPTAVALFFLITSQVIFWVWTFPANVATDQWTEQPANWESLRRQWEYSHLAGSACQLIALTGLIRAALRR